MELAMVDTSSTTARQIVASVTACWMASNLLVHHTGVVEANKRRVCPRQMRQVGRVD